MGALAEGARNDTDWLKHQDTKSLPKELGAARKAWTIRISVSLRGGSRTLNKCNNGGMPDKLSIFRILSDNVSWFVDLSLPRLKLRQYGPDSHCQMLAEAFPTSDQLGELGRFTDDQQQGSGNGRDESWLVAPQQFDYHGNVAKKGKFLLDILTVREGAFYGAAATWKRNFG